MTEPSLHALREAIGHDRQVPLWAHVAGEAWLAAAWAEADDPHLMLGILSCLDPDHTEALEEGWAQSDLAADYYGYSMMSRWDHVEQIRREFPTVTLFALTVALESWNQRYPVPTS